MYFILIVVILCCVFYHSFSSKYVVKLDVNRAQSVVIIKIAVVLKTVYVHNEWEAIITKTLHVYCTLKNKFDFMPLLLSLPICAEPTLF